MANSDQFLEEFLLEAEEIFDQLDQSFVQLEKTPEDKKLVGNIFRAMHTLKGSSGFFAFKRIEKVAHAGESLLGKIREGTRVLDESATNVLLQTMDRLREIVKGIETTSAEPQGDDSQLVADLKTLMDGGSLAPRQNSAAPAPENALEPAAEPVASEAQAEPTPIEVAHKLEQEPANPTPVADAVELLQVQLQGIQVQAQAEAPKSSELAQPLKVNVELLDRLMNMVSELVLARNRLLSFATNSGDANFTSTVRTIDMVTLGLQTSMMETRMQPISNVWSKFPRLVRDTAQMCSKKVELVQLGAETELDRTLLESIRDPLMHIVRNSVDHGIESPELRAAKGKKETGTITLSSMHENGMVVITISDDGAGINLPLVAQKAVQKGLATPERVAKMSERELMDFIFLPGFSTKEVVSNLSGRGVGMDVVRTNVQQIGGNVDVISSDQGTKLRIRIPLTLAIMPAVFVRCGNQRFAIPQNNLFEMVRHKKGSGSLGLEDFYGVPVFRLRNKLIPVLFLNKELQIHGDDFESKEALSIVVVQAAGICFGLIVDEVLFMQEVVVKSVGPLLKRVTVYSGATILGDGHVALIFDIGGIAIRSGLISKLLENDFQENIDDGKSAQEEGQSALLFDLINQDRIALPLDYVDRLENFPAHRIERRGPHDVIVYGDKIMRLIWLSDYIEGKTPSSDYRVENISVVVHYHKGQPLGFVVKQVHDIVSLPNEIIMLSPPQPGVMGSAILDDNVVSILNVDDIIRRFEKTHASENPAHMSVEG
jgi:two-component system chemotaxis sensor kinase CheA